MMPIEPMHDLTQGERTRRKEWIVRIPIGRRELKLNGLVGNVPVAPPQESWQLTGLKGFPPAVCSLPFLAALLVALVGLAELR